jgi:mannose-6-phosphate isomerase
MRMRPILKPRVWGGYRLADLLGKPLPADARIGESWELADLPGGCSLVADGPLAGKTLREVLQRHDVAVLGREGVARGWGRHMGLLIKFIDASDRLSVQVHPDNAHAPGESGKTECWVVVHAEPGAWLAHGLKPGVTREQLAVAVSTGRFEELLHIVPAREGDFFWVPAGMVHAIGPGLVLAEVQQSSDLTYRLYDWNRVDLDGKPRPLHIREAMDVVRLAGESPPSGGRGRTVDEVGLIVDHLVDCPSFSLSRIVLDHRSWSADTGGAMAALVVLAGSALLATAEGSMDLRAGDTVLVPADAAQYALQQAQQLTVLVAAPPGKAPQ